jgi:glucoamylase
MWKFNRQPRSAPAGTTLRVLAGAPFRLHFVGDDQALEDRDSSATSIGMHFTDVPLTRTRRTPVRFTFYWPDSQRWEGREFQVDVKPDARERP